MPRAHRLQEAAWELNADFSRRVAVHAARLPWIPSPMAGVERRMWIARGLGLIPLFCDCREEVRLERWAPGAAVTMTVPGGAQVLVLDGDFYEGGERFEAQSWLRLPAGSTPKPMPVLRAARSGSKPAISCTLRAWTGGSAQGAGLRPHRTVDKSGARSSDSGCPHVQNADFPIDPDWPFDLLGDIGHSGPDEVCSVDSVRGFVKIDMVAST
jgi:hypothetical protein